MGKGGRRGKGQGGQGGNHSHNAPRQQAPPPTADYAAAGAIVPYGAPPHGAPAHGAPPPQPQYYGAPPPPYYGKGAPQGHQQPQYAAYPPQGYVQYGHPPPPGWGAPQLPPGWIQPPPIFIGDMPGAAAYGVSASAVSPSLGKGGQHNARTGKGKKGGKGQNAAKVGTFAAKVVGKSIVKAQNGKAKKEVPKSKEQLDNDLDAYFTGKTVCADEKAAAVEAGAKVIKLSSGPMIVLPSSSPYAAATAIPAVAKLDDALDKYMASAKADSEAASEAIADAE